MNAIATMHENPISRILGTGFMDFSSPYGVHGLAKHVGDDRLDILAIAASKPRTGQCRRFIAACKREYVTISVWHIDNLILREALKRWGFVPAKEFEPDGELKTGMQWTKETRARTARSCEHGDGCA